MIIGIIGRARHGKSMACELIKDIIINDYGIDVVELSLGTHLKKESLKYVGLDTIEELDHYKNTNTKIHGIDVRALLQQIAKTNVSKDKLYYCNVLGSEIKKLSRHTVVVISDIRFKHEYDYFKQLKDSVYLKVHRNNTDEPNHDSEKEIPSLAADFNVLNEDLAVYKKDISEVAHMIMNDHVRSRAFFASMLAMDTEF